MTKWKNEGQSRKRMLIDLLPAGLRYPLLRLEALGDRSPWRLRQELSVPPAAAAAPLLQEETTWDVKAVQSPLQTPRSPWKHRGWKGKCYTHKSHQCDNLYPKNTVIWYIMFAVPVVYNSTSGRGGSLRWCWAQVDDRCYCVSVTPSLQMD